MSGQGGVFAIGRLDVYGGVSYSKPGHSQAAAVAVALIGAGCGGSQRALVNAHVTVTSYAGGARNTQSFSLRCGPGSGTLPLAARICGDITRHPEAMLRPLPGRSTCAGRPNMPELTITSTSGGKTTTFAGAPGCGWPGGTPLAIYFAVTRRDTHALDLMEPRLRCDDDPVLLARPTPNASVAACVPGLWTRRTERLIRLAEHAPSLA